MWWNLGALALINATMAVFTFDARLRTHPTYAAVCFLLGLGISACWYYGTRSTSVSKDIYGYSLMWDAATALPFLLIPVIFYNVRLTWVEILGVLMVWGGLFLFKGAVG